MAQPIIEFKNFGFQYDAQAEPTLYNIDLTIQPGERVLIAGPSGSGKSTIASCINGLIPFSYPGKCTGSLMVDGVDAPHASIFELSKHVGTVLQDPDGQFIGLTVGEPVCGPAGNEADGVTGSPPGGRGEPAGSGAPCPERRPEAACESGRRDGGRCEGAAVR